MVGLWPADADADALKPAGGSFSTVKDLACVDALRDELLARGLFLDSGVPGLYGRSATFEAGSSKSKRSVRIGIRDHSCFSPANLRLIIGSSRSRSHAISGSPLRPLFQSMTCGSAAIGNGTFRLSRS